MSMQSLVPEAFPSVERARLTQQESLVRRLNRNNAVASGLLWVITMIVAVLFVAIIINVVWTGAATLINPSFYGAGPGGIASELFNTFYILILTQIFLVPISLSAAIYLAEYLRGGFLLTVVHFAAETLAGVPSLVLGMFGYLIFAVDIHLGISRLSGALTLLCLNFPLALRLFEDALNTVPRDLREGSLALGATKWRTIRTVVLPSALPGIITGLILTSGKVIGEAAALLCTMGTFNPANVFTPDPGIASDTLTTRLYYLKGNGIGSTGLGIDKETAIAAGISAVLILLLLVINLGSRAVGRAIQRKLTAA